MFGYTFSLYKYYQTTLNSKQRTEKLKTKIPRYRNTKSQNTERKKQNADLHKPVLNKIMTARE